MMTRASVRGLVVVTSVLALLLIAAGSVRSEQRCQICHGKTDHHKIEASGKRVSLFVDESLLGRSTHAKLKCTECHADIIELPHREVAAVNCRRCHYEGNPVGAPDHDGLYDKYAHSVHGQEVAAGNPRAAVCQDCHGSHLVLPPDSTESKIHHSTIPTTCGNCHIETFAHYKESVHGEALAAGNMDSPVCTSCHGEHEIIRPSDSRSRVARLQLTETCSECHGEHGVVAKYGVETDRIKTFEESFHGVASVLGDVMVANCSSCHGYHDVRAKDDPRSSIHPANVVHTCGAEGCHPNASVRFATGQVHVDPGSEKSGILFYISRFFMILTVSTLIGLFIFIILDLSKRARLARSGK